VLSESSPQSFHGIADWSNGRFDYRKIFQAGISGLLDLKEHSADSLKLYQSWLLIVEAYSQRELTKSSDSLAALVGIASNSSKLLPTSILPDYGADICGGNFSGLCTLLHPLVLAATRSKTRHLRDHQMSLLVSKINS
jgi:hypothetical protein